MTVKSKIKLALKRYYKRTTVEQVTELKEFRKTKTTLYIYFTVKLKKNLKVLIFCQSISGNNHVAVRVHDLKSHRIKFINAQRIRPLPALPIDFQFQLLE